MLFFALLPSLALSAPTTEETLPIHNLKADATSMARTGLSTSYGSGKYCKWDMGDEINAKYCCTNNEAEYEAWVASYMSLIATFVTGQMNGCDTTDGTFTSAQQKAYDAGMSLTELGLIEAGGICHFSCNKQPTGEFIQQYGYGEHCHDDINFNLCCTSSEEESDAWAMAYHSNKLGKDCDDTVFGGNVYDVAAE